VCMLAYYVEFHMRRRLAPLLYDDDDRAAAQAARGSIVAKAERSAAARAKETTGVTADGLPVHSLRSLLADLATYTRCEAVTALANQRPIILYPRLTPTQERAFQLIGINPKRTQ